MATEHRAALAKIRRFDQLVAYLRDEMGWPIENGSDFEDLTFEYTPEELGIDAKSAAKIQEIKRLRPLTPQQPWGIFFVKFEPKRLPVVALRRILGRVALKKRASANASERQAWAADDLLFVSNYGDGDSRQISFAHFSRAQDGRDLPTLKVLGWDNRDTLLHLDAVARELSDHLAWPNDEDDADAWRERWRAAFTLQHREVVTTSKDLSDRLAELARAIRDRIQAALAIETDNGPLTKLMKAFQTALVHDLDSAGFADMYAQTIAYGLLSARITDPQRSTADDFAAHMRTNPFLRELMETFLKVGGRRGKAGGPGIDFDELGASEVVDMLDAANMEAVVRDFGDRNPQEDPVIHFYEHFLAAYDKKQKVSRGVFYTPRPVVAYIVRSVDELLRTEFGLAEGLADTTTWGEMAERYEDLKIPEGVSLDQDFVQILDPASGTGTFLVEVIDVIFATLVAKWKAAGHRDNEIDALWNEYVPKHLLTRLHGYELLMAPYAIAHLKIGLKLHETGYRFGSGERARVYLTNALEPASDKQLTLDFLPALAHEAHAVNGIKRRQRFTAVVGNPPYSNFGQLNRIPFILNLLDTYKQGLNERKLNLDDDYIKFIRFAHHTIDVTRVGIVGMITNNVFLDGITHREMRRSLRSSFSLIAVCDLHGSVKKLEVAPDGTIDENVFDIQQGVGITFFVKWSRANACLQFTELWGRREEKYAALLGLTVVDRTHATALSGEAPYYFFVPKVFIGQESWDQWIRIPDLMRINATGVKTHLDKVFVGFSEHEVEAGIAQFLDATWRKVPLSSAKRASPLRKALLLKAALRSSKTSSVEDYAYRAMDMRKVAYLPSAVEAGDHRYPVMKHLLVPNVALVTTRQLSQGEFAHAFVTRAVSDMCLLSTATKECAYVFPLRLVEDGDLLGSGWNRVNLSEPACKFLTQMGGGPDDFLHYAYSVLYSPEYRTRFAEFLRIDFPRLPLAGNPELFRALARLGGELTALHLLESPKLAKPITEFIGGPNPEVEKVSWSKSTVWIDKSQAKGFKGVREDVWNFHIGGYQVCNKWLKDRKGCTLSNEGIAHYQKIVLALSETIRLMGAIDEVIEQHGGWPGAFLKIEDAGHDTRPLPRAAEPKSDYGTKF